MAFNFGSFAGGMSGGLEKGMRLKRMMMQGQQPPQMPPMMEEELNPFPLEDGGGYEGFQAMPQQQGTFGGLKELMMRLFGR